MNAPRRALVIGGVAGGASAAARLRRLDEQAEMGKTSGQYWRWMGAFVEIDAVDELERALGKGGDGAFAIESEDGRYSISLKRIVYVKRFTREARVGFTPG